MSFTTLSPSPDPAAFWRASSVIEGSEFLAFAIRADSPEEAQQARETLRGRYPDATHHCWAYQIGERYRFSDDGEPGGTAGSPILKAIQGQGLDHTLCAVARYYGGVKLGTGGLARAYGGVASECLRLAAFTLVRPRWRGFVSVPYEHLSALYHLLGQYDAPRGTEQYSGAGVSFWLELFPEDASAFARALRDATRGAGIWQPEP